MLMFNPYAIQDVLHLLQCMSTYLERFYDLFIFSVKNEADSSLLALDKKSKEEAISMLELSRHDQQRALFSVYK